MVATQQRPHRGPKASPYRGVARVPERDRWRAQISVAGRLHYLGAFVDPVEAAMAYDDAALLYRGDRARLNFPDGPPSTVYADSQLRIPGLDSDEGDPVLNALPCFGREDTWIVYEPGPRGFCELVTVDTCPCGVPECTHQTLVRSIEQKGGR